VNKTQFFSLNSTLRNATGRCTILHWNNLYSKVCYLVIYDANLLPRFPLLCLPCPLRERPWLWLLTWPPMTQNLFMGVELTKNLNWSERNAIVYHRYIKTTHGRYTFEILQSYCKLHTVKRNKFVYIQRIEVSIRFQFQPVDFILRRKTVSLFRVAWTTDIVRCIKRINFLIILQNIILDYAKESCLNNCPNINLNKPNANKI